MGTIFTPTYATLLMGYFEMKLYSVCTFKYGEPLAGHIKENWNRFLHDCYTVLRSSKVSPEELLFILNLINSSIQFTMNHSKDQIPFLDILIKKTKTVFGWTCTINPYLLHPVTQTIINEISHFF